MEKKVMRKKNKEHRKLLSKQVKLGYSDVSNNQMFVIQITTVYHFKSKYNLNLLSRIKGLRSYVMRKNSYVNMSIKFIHFYFQKD